MTYPITPNSDEKMLRINNALCHIAAREGAIHRLQYAIHSPVESDRCATRTTKLLTGLGQTHPHDAETITAMDKTLGKLERRPHLLFNRDQAAATEHLIHTCMLLLKQSAQQGLHDSDLGRLYESHLTHALIKAARTTRKRKGLTVQTLDRLLNPPNDPDDPTPATHMLADIPALKPAIARMTLKILNALTDVDDRLRAYLYLKNDINLILPITHPDLTPKIHAWLDTPIMPAHQKPKILTILKNWVPR